MAIRRASCQIKDMFVGLHTASKRRLSVQGNGFSVRFDDLKTILKRNLYLNSTKQIRNHEKTRINTVHPSNRLAQNFDFSEVIVLLI